MYRPAEHLVPRAGDRSIAGAGGARAGCTASLGAHHYDGDLFAVHGAHALDPATVSRITQVGTGISEHHTHGSIAMAYSAGCVRVRA